MNGGRGARNTSHSGGKCTTISAAKVPIYGLHFSHLAVLCVWSAKRERVRESDVKREPQTGNIFVQPEPRGGSGNVLDCAFHSIACTA